VAPGKSHHHHFRTFQRKSLGTPPGMPIWYKFAEFWGWKQAKPPEKNITIIII
jgi:hypothetical protein